MKQRYVILRKVTPQVTPLNVQVLYTTYGGTISDCTNGGVTSKNERVILVPEGCTAEQIADLKATATLPILKVVRRNIGGREYLHAEPIDAPGRNPIGSWMAGGNFVYSSDSRYSQWVAQYPISVHDRTETPEQYDLLSR